jgi:hypothetical protein
MRPGYDIFISYSHKDRSWVQDWLLPRLQAAGIEACVDEREFTIGAQLVDSIESAVALSRKVVLVLTPDWLESRWTLFESHLAYLQGHPGRILPIVLRPCEVPDRYQTLVGADFTDRGRWSAEAERLIKAILEPAASGPQPTEASPEEAGLSRKSRSSPKIDLAEVSLYLESAFGGLDLGGLAAQAMEIESQIQTLLYKALMDDLSQAIRSFSSLGNFSFRVHDRIYEIKIGPRVATSTLEVLVDASDSLRDLPEDGPKIAIDGWGRFKGIEVFVDKSLKGYQDRICTAVRWVYSTAYGWLKSFVLRKLGEFELDCSASLYNHLQVLCSASSRDYLADDVWFAIFSGDHGYYLLDRDSARKIADILAESSTFLSDRGPLYNLLQLVGLKMPYEVSESRKAIEKWGYHEFSLSRTNYIKEKLDLVKTEEQIAGGTRFGLYPVSRRGHIKLVAAFPPAYKEPIIKLLKDGRRDFERIFESKLGQLGEYVRLLEKNFSKMDWAVPEDSLAGWFREPPSRPPVITSADVEEG